MGNANSFPRPEDDFYTKCGDFHDQNGSLLVQQIGRGLQWVTFVVSWFQLAFYGYQSVKSTLGWEETYVCVVEAIKITFDIFFMYSTPATIYQTNGNTVSWLTYSEWLLTCPVILVQLCNITGLESDFSNRTMQVLVSDVGAIVMGTYAAFSAGWLKAVFFLLGCSYGAFTFYHAAKVYIESYYMVPKGLCRNLVKAMAWCFFTSWVGFPIIFLAGPDGFGHLSIWAEVAAQQICEIFSKNVWGFLGHFLRVKIHEFIIIHGDCRKLSKVKFAGKELMVMSYVEKDGNDTIRTSTRQHVQRRASFTKMRDLLKKRGVNTRKSIDRVDFNPKLAYEDNIPGMPEHVKREDLMDSNGNMRPQIQAYPPDYLQAGMAMQKMMNEQQSGQKNGFPPMNMDNEQMMRMMAMILQQQQAVQQQQSAQQQPMSGAMGARVQPFGGAEASNSGQMWGQQEVAMTPSMQPQQQGGMFGGGVMSGLPMASQQMQHQQAAMAQAAMAQQQQQQLMMQQQQLQQQQQHHQLQQPSSAIVGSSVDTVPVPPPATVQMQIPATDAMPDPHATLPSVSTTVGSGGGQEGSAASPPPPRSPVSPHTLNLNRQDSARADEVRAMMQNMQHKMHNSPLSIRGKPGWS
uniref:Uncharacterized protein n=2 Tax=Tetraselmis chuii TaxID=63592 RepID=A0A7S1SYD0_9CHLO|mmetsp:Transcript_36022/g.64411  ORF Transcript_36022/g.64411 Transcript_36022/m.64411 type:complete len:629 (+) Transcript_36022:452-2338(+)